MNYYTHQVNPNTDLYHARGLHSGISGPAHQLPILMAMQRGTARSQRRVEEGNRAWCKHSSRMQRRGREAGCTHLLCCHTMPAEA